MSITIESSVGSDPKYLESVYTNRYSVMNPETKKIRIESNTFNFRTEVNVGKVGLLMVGFGGNNGSTILGGILANKNKVTWHTKKG